MRAAVLALLVALVTAVALGASLSVTPGSIALGAIVAMGVAHLVLQARGARPDAAVMARAGALAVIATAAWFALQAGADRLFAGTLAPAPSGSLLLPILVTAAFAAAFMLQALLPHRTDRPRWRAAYVHLSNGLYVNTVANRLVARLWPLAPHH